MGTLTSLNLSECVHVSGAEMAKGLKGSGSSPSQLESLTLTRCIYIRVSPEAWVGVEREKGGGQTGPFSHLSLQDAAVVSLAQLLGDTLRELDLTSCANLTDLAVCSIAAHLRKLVVLRLARCKEITDWGLLGMAEAAQSNSDQEMVRPFLWGE